MSYMTWHAAPAETLVLKHASPLMSAERTWQLTDLMELTTFICPGQLKEASAGVRLVCCAMCKVQVKARPGALAVCVIHIVISCVHSIYYPLLKR